MSSSSMCPSSARSEQIAGLRMPPFFIGLVTPLQCGPRRRADLLGLLDQDAVEIGPGKNPLYSTSIPVFWLFLQSFDRTKEPWLYAWIHAAMPGRVGNRAPLVHRQ